MTNVAANVVANTTTATPPVEPSTVEQEHVKQALEASNTAIDAISTVLAISSWTLGIIAVFLGIVALWGYAAIKRAAGSEAKQIANERFNAYIETDEFKDLVKAKIEKSVQDRWQNTVVVSRLSEEPKMPDDPSPFPSGDAK